MSNKNKIIAKSLLNSKGKVKRNIDSIDSGIFSVSNEWIKWLSYEPKFDKERRKKLRHKNIEKLSEEELRWLCEYKHRKYMLDLFIRNAKGECSSSEYEKIYYYMEKPIEDLMLDKLSKKELKEARAKIIRLKKSSLEELNKKVKEEQEPKNYDKLSMVDSYVLHVISGFVYKRNIMRDKSMIYGKMW